MAAENNMKTSETGSFKHRGCSIESADKIYDISSQNEGMFQECCVQCRADSGSFTGCAAMSASRIPSRLFFPA